MCHMLALSTSWPRARDGYLGDLEADTRAVRAALSMPARPRHEEEDPTAIVPQMTVLLRDGFAGTAGKSDLAKHIRSCV